MSDKLTDKKLADRRFRTTEEAILGAFFEGGENFNIGVVLRRAKISRATFYRHHKTVYDVVPDCEEYVLGEFNKMIESVLLDEKIGMRTIYYKMLGFIMNNREIFSVVVNNDRRRALKAMINSFELKIALICGLPSNGHKILNIYKNEVIGVLEEWIRSGFCEGEADVMEDIMYLTETVKFRLGKLMK